MNKLLNDASELRQGQKVRAKIKGFFSPVYGIVNHRAGEHVHRWVLCGAKGEIVLVDEFCKTFTADVLAVEEVSKKKPFVDIDGSTYQERVAKKNHTCLVCKKTIPPLTTYINQTISSVGYQTTYRSNAYHKECFEARLKKQEERLDLQRQALHKPPTQRVKRLIETVSQLQKDLEETKKELHDWLNKCNLVVRNVPNSK